MLGSFSFVQLLGNVFTTILAMHNCTASPSTRQLLWTGNLLMLFGISILGSNLLCHRYIAEKARVVTKHMSAFDTSGKSEQQLRRIDAAFRWRSTSFAPFR